MLTLHSVYYDDMIPNWRMPPVLVEYNILILVISGKLVYSINHSKFLAEKGDLIFIPKGTFRAAENDGPLPHQKYSVLFNHSFSPGIVPLFDHHCFTMKKIGNFKYLASRFSELHRVQLEKKAMYPLISTGILQELTGIASRESESAGISPAKWILAEKMQNYIRDNYRKQLGVNELADLIQRSPNYTISLFKEVTGQTPVQYMQQLRIAEAQNLLLNTDFTISEIAGHLGFYDTSYFYRTFRKVTSMSPSDFSARRERLN